MIEKARIYDLLLWALLLLLFFACQPGIINDESLLSTLWLRASGEYQACVLQSYQMAQEMVLKALQDSSWTAALEQKGKFTNFPPAVIMDIDQTILDNSPIKGQMIREKVSFDWKIWHDWLMSANAPALPGALDFVEFAREQGVAVFYVTNRLKTYQSATLRNLVSRGFPVDTVMNHLLTQDKDKDWDDDKTSRRDLITQSYRILLVIGDDLNDFLPAKVLPEERIRLVNEYSGFWGNKWIILPNPLYGSWEQSLYHHQTELSERQMRELKANYLK